MQSAELLIIFVKNPEAGKVKTRLAESIGEKEALNVYRWLLEYTAGVAGRLEMDREVWYSNHLEHKDAWPDSVFTKNVQRGHDLGERMKHAFGKAFEKGYKKVVLIGSDCAEITQHHIGRAFDELTGNAVVLGPSEDGGYYLIGMSRFHPFLFENKPWSTPDLFAETMEAAGERNVSVELLPVLNDVDTIDDLQNTKQGKRFIS